MKPIILFFITVLFAVSLFGQEGEKEKKLFPFNEFSISVNRTHVSSFGNENKFGCGAGIYHSYTPKTWFDLMLGMEYNYTSQFASIQYKTPIRHRDDVTFYIHDVSVPLFSRFNIGKNVKCFFETGIFFDFAFIAIKKGYGTYLLDGEEIITELRLNAKGMIGSPRIGILAGMGMRIPMKSIEWIVKVDYKIGTRSLLADDYKLHHQYYRLGVGIRKRK